MVAGAQVGPKPVPPSKLTVQSLAEAIRFCLSDGARGAAPSLAERMAHETGVAAAVQSFHKSLDVEALRCDILPDQAAAWSCESGKKCVKISKLAAEALVRQRPSMAKRMKL